MNETLAYLKTFAQLPLSLRRFARHTLTLEEAQRIVRERMERREENFLRTIERTVYSHPTSPYLTLLNMAGCQFGDLQALVKQQGLEGALRALRDEDVYVTFEEFKGRKPIVRDGVKIQVTPWDFDNPFARRHFAFETGGSTGAASNVAMDVDHIAERAPYRLITLDAHGILDAPSANWRGILPDNALSSMLRLAYAGKWADRWFTPIGWRDSKYWLKYSATTCYVLFWMRLYGMRVPFPEVIRVDQAQIVARWMAKALKTHGQCLLHTTVSRGVRACLAAQEAGLDLKGATIWAGGEPASPAKLQEMERVGVRYISSYAMVEAGGVASGCAQPVDGTDVHVFKDGYALFSHPYTLEGLGMKVPAFNLTTLLPAAPKVMLNVQMDDYGIVEERRCGCQLESYGYTTHLRQIRSYSKLTGEGATLLGTEMVRILEELLPARFGGGPLDYQIMEEEDRNGLTRLSLVISSGVQIDSEAAVVEFVLNALRGSSPMADAARTIWQHAGTIQVKRTEPVWTERGKLLPLHMQPPNANP